MGATVTERNRQLAAIRRRLTKGVIVGYAAGLYAEVVSTTETQVTVKTDDTGRTLTFGLLAVWPVD